MGLVSWRRRVAMFVDEIVVFVIAKLVERKVFGVDTEKVEEQFMYCC